MEATIKEKIQTEHQKREIIRRIRKQYSVDDEIAILRQKESKPEEYAEWEAYVEQCKTDVKNAIPAWKKQKQQL